MKFMLISYDDEQAWIDAGDAAHKAAMNEAVQLSHDIHRKGQYILAQPLHHSSTAKCLRIRNGKRIVTDGPFAETREVIGGFYLIDVKDIEEAIEIAARHPGLRFGAVEIRQVLDLPGLPE